MTILAYVAIVLVVWLIIALPQGRLQAVIYSLPIPMSVALASSSPALASASQVLGVPLLVLFFLLICIGERRLGRVAAVVISTCLLVGLAAAIHAMVVVEWANAYLLASLLWLLGIIASVFARQRVSTTTDKVNAEESIRRLGWFQALIAAAATTAVSFFFGLWIGPFVVTFPYSGLPVALLLAGNMAKFTVEFSMRSILLTIFLVAHHEATLRVPSIWVALAFAWVAYLTGFAVYQSVRWAIVRRQEECVGSRPEGPS